MLYVAMTGAKQTLLAQAVDQRTTSPTPAPPASAPTSRRSAACRCSATGHADPGVRHGRAAGRRTCRPGAVHDHRPRPRRRDAGRRLDRGAGARTAARPIPAPAICSVDANGLLTNGRRPPGTGQRRPDRHAADREDRDRRRWHHLASVRSARRPNTVSAVDRIKLVKPRRGRAHARVPTA
ncbi:MAG: hypothetical protein MZV65_52165 [Chromatiales bacterium]|nr:hypothetical protein [Chromatiales bacterium]